MCGIAGIIHRDAEADVGSEMASMLQSMKHRGPDSTGYALFGPPSDLVVIRFKLADANVTALGRIGVSRRARASSFAGANAQYRPSG